MFSVFKKAGVSKQWQTIIWNQTLKSQKQQKLILKPCQSYLLEKKLFAHSDTLFICLHHETE